jgi:hypothetical protein
MAVLILILAAIGFGVWIGRSRASSLTPAGEAEPAHQSACFDVPPMEQSVAGQAANPDHEGAAIEPDAPSSSITTNRDRNLAVIVFIAGLLSILFVGPLAIATIPAACIAAYTLSRKDGEEFDSFEQKALNFFENASYSSGLAWLNSLFFAIYNRSGNASTRKRRLAWSLGLLAGMSLGVVAVALVAFQGKAKSGVGSSGSAANKGGDGDLTNGKNKAGAASGNDPISRPAQPAKPRSVTVKFFLVDQYGLRTFNNSGFSVTSLGSTSESAVKYRLSELHRGCEIEIVDMQWEY